MLSFGRTAMGEGEICGELVGTADVPLDAEITPLQISTLEGSAAPLRVEFGELSREPRGSLQRLHLPIRVSLARDELVASFRMRVELTGDWIDPSGFVVSGEVHQGWYLDRSKLHLGAVRVGRSRKYDLRLMYTADPPPRIDRVESDRETFTATWRADEQSRSLVVELCFTPESEGEDRARVEVWVEGSAQPLLLEVAGRAQ